MCVSLSTHCFWWGCRFGPAWLGYSRSTTVKQAPSRLLNVGDLSIVTHILVIKKLKLLTKSPWCKLINHSTKYRYRATTNSYSADLDYGQNVYIATCLPFWLVYGGTLCLCTPTQGCTCTCFIQQIAECILSIWCQLSSGPNRTLLSCRGGPPTKNCNCCCNSFAPKAVIISPGSIVPCDHVMQIVLEFLLLSSSSMMAGIVVPTFPLKSYLWHWHMSKIHSVIVVTTWCNRVCSIHWTIYMFSPSQLCCASPLWGTCGIWNIC